MNANAVISKSVLKASLKKATLLGQLENLISYQPWIPSEVYREGIEKIVKKIMKLNKKMGLNEDIIVSGIVFPLCQG